MFKTFIKGTIDIPQLSWNKRYVNSIANDFLRFHLESGYFKQVRSLSPKNVFGSKRFIKLRTQLANNRVMLNKISKHIFREFE